MATYTQLSNGSKGDDVKKLQQALIDAGYNVGSTGADGIFGKNTLAAVKQYQKDNGLAVDGIAGKNTLGSLYGYASGGSYDTKPSTGTNTGASTPTTPSTPSAGGNDGTATETPADTPTTSNPGFTYDPWNAQDDPLIQEALGILQQVNANKPGDYTPVWLDEANKYLSEYQNRDPFSYDFNADALYNQYKDQYIQQGKMAMMDTMGQAQAMTGGYGSSYAQTVGQQAYNQQLNNLNDVIPELAQMAYDRYNQEGQDLMNMYGIYLDRENQEYSRYQDSLTNWYTQAQMATKNYNTAYDRGYDNYLLGYNTALDEYISNKNQNFTEKVNAKSDLVTLITATGYKPTDSELNAAGMTREQAEGYLKAYTDSQSSSGNGYLKLEAGSEAYKTITADISIAEDIDRVDELAEYYTGLGYDPAAISWIATMRKRELKGASGTGSSGSSSVGT